MSPLQLLIGSLWTGGRSKRHVYNTNGATFSRKRPRKTFTMVIVIEDLVAFKAALKNAGGKLVVVDFTATWCGPCQMIGPVFKALSENPENANVVFLKVDVDDANDVSSHCDIKCMPTFQFYKNGKKIDEFSGANKAELELKIKAHK